MRESPAIAGVGYKAPAEFWLKRDANHAGAIGGDRQRSVGGERDGSEVRFDRRHGIGELRGEIGRPE